MDDKSLFIDLKARYLLSEPSLHRLAPRADGLTKRSAQQQCSASTEELCRAGADDAHQSTQPGPEIQEEILFHIVELQTRGITVGSIAKFE